jgi:arylsulfatase
LALITRPSTQTFARSMDLGFAISLDYFDKAPFAFNGTIGTTRISYPKK